MNHVLKSLGDISVEAFLSEYWQKKPLLIRNAFPGFESPLTPDELAGLALEEEVESRIVIENTDQGPWQLLNGPFDEKQFQQLPETHWTLLVQAVDQWVPEAKTILEQFHFLPSWRTDDLMVSYAPEGGSVGPHFDYYDVFLIQGLGRRHWQVGKICDDDSPRLSGTSLRILKDFEVENEWTLEPGDMLYLPPQFAHNGVALEDCLTYSVGFRAPSVGEIIDDVATDAISRYRDHHRYTDPAIAPDAPIGEVSDAAITKLQNILQQALMDKESLGNWLGRYMTNRKYPDLDISPEATEEWRNHLDIGGSLERNPASRFAYRVINYNQTAELYVDGEAVVVSHQLAQLLASQDPLNKTSLALFLTDTPSDDVINQLVEYGALYTN